MISQLEQERNTYSIVRALVLVHHVLVLLVLDVRHIETGLELLKLQCRSCSLR